MSQASLLALGSNGSGQLGIGHTNDENSAQECKLLIAGPEDDELWPDLWPSPIRMIKGGGSHTLVLLEDGSLFVSGDISVNRTGLNALTGSISAFKKVPKSVFDGKKVKICSALWENSTVVTEDDEIYTLGLGSKGERGMGEGALGASGRLDRFFPPEEHIIDLASSMAHTVVVLSNGDVHGWGNGRKGQLGEPAGIVWKPRKIERLPFKVVRAVCGREFSYLVGDPSDGHHAILGSDKWNIKSDAPASIPNWQEIAASWGSIFVLDQSGKLHAWGRNDHGQLGVMDHPEPIRRIAAGSEHAMILTRRGAVAFSGWGEHGNCGPRIDPQGDVKEWFQHFPPYVPRKCLKVLGISAGCATSFVWVQPPVVED
ncbi:MAG: hypothetical protein Q9218_006181 [Villophora microphyllina]